jgi:hypothetical protein
MRTRIEHASGARYRRARTHVPDARAFPCVIVRGIVHAHAYAPYSSVRVNSGSCTPLTGANHVLDRWRRFGDGDGDGDGGR